MSLAGDVDVNEARFGPYRVVETIGSGASSSIYRAVQDPLGRVVVLKALNSQISPHSSFGEQLEREAMILRDLAHPNVVLLLDLARTDSGRPYLVLENLEGPSLLQWLAKARVLPVEPALALAVGICAALVHVHERGVVHRDIKPSNVLVTRSGVVKLVDFGIAHRARTLTLSDALGGEGLMPAGRPAPSVVKDAFGTPAYMSPEQILGDFVDARSDLFSLGVVLYETLSGTRPFETEAPVTPALSSRPSPFADRTAGQRMRRETPTPLRERAPYVPRSVDRLVMRLLEKSPSERYANASDVLERLERELRTLTRDDPAWVVRTALAAAGFATDSKVSEVARPFVSRPGHDVRRGFLGQACVLVFFLLGVLAIESGSSARSALEAGSKPLPLNPEYAGGLLVNAVPWADVRVDGQHVETTPFARPIPLAKGKHWVTLAHPDAPPIEREIEVALNETLRLDVTMAVGFAVDAGTETDAH